MRRFITVVGLLFCISFSTVAGFAYPQVVETVGSPKAQASLPTAEDWYRSSVSLLQKGQHFKRAATQLRKAIGMREQAKYHVALGCAFAGRAASLATSNRKYFAADQAKYQRLMTAWEVAQKDQNSPDYGKPSPEPPTLLTEDDSLPFVLTREEAAGQFKTLVEDATAEWDTALSRVKTAQERAETESSSGKPIERRVITATTGFDCRENLCPSRTPPTRNQMR